MIKAALADLKTVNGEIVDLLNGRSIEIRQVLRSRIDDDDDQTSCETVIIAWPAVTSADRGCVSSMILDLSEAARLRDALNAILGEGNTKS